MLQPGLQTEGRNDSPAQPPNHSPVPRHLLPLSRAKWLPHAICAGIRPNPVATLGKSTATLEPLSRPRAATGLLPSARPVHVTCVASTLSLTDSIPTFQGPVGSLSQGNLAFGADRVFLPLTELSGCQRRLNSDTCRFPSLSRHFPYRVRDRGQAKLYHNLADATQVPTPRDDLASQTRREGLDRPPS